MDTPLFHLTVSAETHFVHLHSVCLQVAKWAGIDHMEQFSLAFCIIEQCSLHLREPKEIDFFLAEERDTFLKVTIKNNGEIQHTAKIALTGKPDFNTWSFAAPSTDVQPGWKPEYEDLLRFNYVLSHDLKTSLTKLKLALSLLEEEQVPSSLQYYISVIYRSSAKLESTMLGLNKIIELGHTSSNVAQRLSPALVFEEVLEDFAEYIPNLEKDFSEVGSISYIEVYLKSLYTNMLSNAVKYASSERPLSVEVKAWKEKEMVVLSFSDNGQGIDLDEFGSRIFQPFTRFNNKTEGSGIGLYLIKNMVERNGGRVEVESKVNKGTTFRFYLREYKPATSPV